MNGIFLHGGFAPNGATFLSSLASDYARPAMRLAALMGTGVVYVMTHDSIGLGEDGPTHQPVEHLAALRAIPNMRVFRPCDAIEVTECWELALNRTSGPTVLALTRQNLPQLRTTTPSDNPCSHGAYELVAAQGEAKVSLFASGSEVEIAVAAQKQLVERGIASRVVSVLRWNSLAGATGGKTGGDYRRRAGQGSRDRRPRSGSAGTSLSGPMALLSACTVSAPAPRPRTSTSISELPWRQPSTQPWRATGLTVEIAGEKDYLTPVILCTLPPGPNRASATKYPRGRLTKARPRG